MPVVADPTEAPAESAEGNSSLGSALCTQCGLCCTGALHNYAVLEPEEVEYGRGLGLTLRTEGRPGFALPCPWLKDCACTIYANRPKVCARYKCGLLENLEAGETSLDAALDKVKSAKELVRQVEAVMPAGMTLPEARALCHTEPAESEASGRDQEMKLRLAVTTLSFYLDKYFKNSREGKLLSLETIGEAKPDTEMT